MAFLDLLKVKHTDDFSNRYFNEHPHKYNLFGLSKMLSDYGVDNAGINILEKEDGILKIEAPFVAQVGGYLVVVYKIMFDKVFFVWRGNDHVLPFSKFIEAWTGVVLLAEPSERSIEPDYKEHKKIELFNFLKKYTLFFMCGLILFFAYFNKELFLNPGISILLLLYLSGIYVSRLLVLKQMHIQSQQADKICSIIKYNDCNNVLEDKAAKLFGLISWSEVGFSYFVSNFFILFFLPHFIAYSALINITTLPYTVWSIWYQKFKVKQWCVLCIIVQGLLWMIFLIN